ncbi:hypothetical protein JHK84_049098 [Glycine max]|nr:hypothetical protein JHK84_049098 [Glycine max]
MAVIPTKAEKKVSYDVKLCQLLEDYTQILVVAADNVGSNQLENIRKDLRGDSVLVAPARVGLVAPIDVVVPPGNTGLDPSQTSFFQNVLAVAVATEYSFPEADKVKEYLKDPKYLLWLLLPHLLLILALLQLLPPRRRKRRKNQQKNLTMTWVSVCLIKLFKVIELV